MPGRPLISIHDMTQNTQMRHQSTYTLLDNHVNIINQKRWLNVIDSGEFLSVLKKIVNIPKYANLATTGYWATSGYPWWCRPDSIPWWWWWPGDPSAAAVWWITPLHNFNHQNLNPGLAQILVLRGVFRTFAMMKISNNGPSWK